MPNDQGHIVYCAGPMFSPGDFHEMKCIADSLEGAGYATYLPQRDGIEVASVMKNLNSLPPGAEEIILLMREAVFSLDVYQLLGRCDCAVFNMNGRVPDGGSVAETSMAVSHGRPVIIYKDDPITILMGLDNPLIQGLSYTWTYADSFEMIPKKLTQFIGQYEKLWGAPPNPTLSGYMKGVVEVGGMVWTELGELRKKFPNDPTKVTLGIVSWVAKPDIKPVFEKAFPKAGPDSQVLGRAF